MRSRKEIKQKIETSQEGVALLKPALDNAKKNNQQFKLMIYQHQEDLILQRIRILKWILNEN